MKTKSVLFLLMACSLAACQWGKPDKKTGPAITRDTLKYTYKTIKQRAADCGNKPDSSCTMADIVYPVFAGQVILNDSVAANLLAQIRLDEKPDSTLQEVIQHYFNQYTADKAKGKRTDMFYTLDSKVSVVRQDSNVVVLQFAEYGYFGGAHGSTSTLFMNWDIRSNKKIALKNILADGSYEKLTAIAETIFRKQEKLTPTTPLTPDYFFDKGKFRLNDNFMITPMGLRFLYNEYEIKPYSAGQTELIIPYTQIKSLLRPNTVVTQYLK